MLDKRLRSSGLAPLYSDICSPAASPVGAFPYTGILHPDSPDGLSHQPGLGCILKLFLIWKKLLCISASNGGFIGSSPEPSICVVRPRLIGIGRESVSNANLHLVVSEVSQNQTASSLCFHAIMVRLSCLAKE